MEKVQLSADALNPWRIRPHGDRLFVEVVEISDEVEVNGVKLYTARAIRDGQGKLTEEYLRGFCAGIVMAVGDGHLLTSGSTRQAVVIKTIMTEEEARNAPNLIAYDTDTSEAVISTLSVPSVPMPWTFGDVVLMERLAKRAVEINRRTYAMIDQMDILATVDYLKYIIVDGEWIELSKAVENATPVPIEDEEILV